MTDKFYLGDLVQVKDSHPFHGLAGKFGEIEKFVGDVAAIVRFSRNEAAWDVSNDALEVKMFQGYTWYIALKDLKRHGTDPSSEFGKLLDQQEKEKV